ncbi:fimbrial assembly protein [Paraburkholderia bryophila]|uniref:fimbrial assembly protein n=1 Tax=Paraburkholderia bryophila TaxID=420952 RepID=UPI00234BB6A6|nr:fimbrial assembly protein [Paraburkholderia bryophila]WCM19527.1 fimbrial assembly protein [Paraburkholderia bryophila]
MMGARLLGAGAHPSVFSSLSSSSPSPSRGVRFVRSWLGGFNLLPYRQRNARLARRRRLLEWTTAAIVGSAAVLPLIGWQVFERMQLDAQRASIDQSFTRLSAPLAEHATLLRTRDEQRKNVAHARRLSDPLTHLRDLIDALSSEPGEGVVLQQMRQREHETQMLATSRGHAASAAWLKRLSGIRGVKGAEVSDLHSPATRAAGRAGAGANAGLGAGVSGPVEFGAHLRWDDAGLKTAGKAGVAPSLSIKSELPRGVK